MSATGASATSSGDMGTNTLIQGNTVTGGYFGISLMGNATTLTQGNVVRNN